MVEIYFESRFLLRQIELLGLLLLELSSTVKRGDFGRFWRFSLNISSPIHSIILLFSAFARLWSQEARFRILSSSNEEEQVIFQPATRCPESPHLWGDSGQPFQPVFDVKECICFRFDAC